MVMVWAREKEKKMASRRKKLSIIRFLSLLAPKLFGLGSTLQPKKKNDENNADFFDTHLATPDEVIRVYAMQQAKD